MFFKIGAELEFIYRYLARQAVSKMKFRRLFPEGRQDKQIGQGQSCDASDFVTSRIGSITQRVSLPPPSTTVGPKPLKSAIMTRRDRCFLLHYMWHCRCQDLLVVVLLEHWP